MEQPSVAQLCGYKHSLSYVVILYTMAIRCEKCMHGTSSYRNLWGDHPWLGGTTYGAVDGPARPSMAAMAGPSMATKFAIDGLAGQVVGGPSVA